MWKWPEDWRGKFPATRRALKLALCVALIWPALSVATPGALREWTLNDSILVRYFSDSQYWPELWPNRPENPQPGDPAVVISPDGKFLFAVSHQGNLQRDSNIYELSVFETSSVRRALRDAHSQSVAPIATVKLETVSSRLPAIVGARWQPESRAITYLGMTDEQLQVYRLDIPSGTTTKVSDLPSDPGEISARSPNAYVYKDGAAIIKVGGGTTLEMLPATYPMLLSKRPVNGGASAYADPNYPPDATYVASRSGRTWRLDGMFSAWAVQPGGRSAVAIREVRDDKGQRKEKRFVLVDLETETVAPLLDADVGDSRGGTDPLSGNPLPAPYAEWSTDGRNVILINTRAPKESTGDGSPAVIRFDVESHRWLRVKWAKEGPPKRSMAKLAGLSIFVKQGADELPALVATDHKRQVALISPAVELAGIRRAQVVTLEWAEKEGTVRGQLFLPPQTDSDTPLPLIVESVLGVFPGSFLPDGPVSAGYATQAYAAQGFAVLRIPFVRGNDNDEGPAFVRRLDYAIAAAESKHPIDRTRIGAMGHSRTGYQVLYAITHPGSTHLSAAAILDSFNGAFASYTEGGAAGLQWEPERDFTSMPGGSFWERKAEWLEHEISFNVDRVTTPALFSLHMPPRRDSSLQLLSAFNLNRRPVEYMWLPEASHMLLRPRERLAETGTVLQWMKFWLKDQPPADADLATRWAPLREMQQAVLRQPAPPRMKWTAAPVGSGMAVSEAGR